MSFRDIKKQIFRSIDSVDGLYIRVIILKEKPKAIWFFFIAYLSFLLLCIWLTLGMPGLNSQFPKSTMGLALKDFSSAYSPVLLDIVIVFLISLLILLLYSNTFRTVFESYKNRYLKSSIRVLLDTPDRCIQFSPETKLEFNLQDKHFKFNDALDCTLKTSYLGSNSLFHSIQGRLDFAKLALDSVARTSGNKIQINLGSSSFHNTVLCHYWAHLPLAPESTDETNTTSKTIFTLLKKSQLSFIDSIKKVLTGEEIESQSSDSPAPNPMGLSVFIKVKIGDHSQWLFRKRTNHVAADAGKLCAAVAGLVDVYPDFHRQGKYGLAELIEQEYQDEVEDILSEYARNTGKFNRQNLTYHPLGIVFTAESNFQPELYCYMEINLTEGMEGSFAFKDDVWTDLVAEKWRKEIFFRKNIDDDLKEELRPRDKRAVTEFKEILLL